MQKSPALQTCGAKYVRRYEPDDPATRNRATPLLHGQGEKRCRAALVTALQDKETPTAFWPRTLLQFLGDSITEGWGKAPEVWKQYYAKHNAANFGISGDRTEHVLWRIANGELNGIQPKVVVLMIGTNNSGRNTAEEIAAADRKIVQEIRSQLPQSKILLLAIFPRGPRKGPNGARDDGVERMAKINAVNAELAKLDDGKNVRFLNINEKFLIDGKIPDDVMPDQLHPNAKGYQIWAEAMQPLLDEMMR